MDLALAQRRELLKQLIPRPESKVYVQPRYLDHDIFAQGAVSLVQFIVRRADVRYRFLYQVFEIAQQTMAYTSDEVVRALDEAVLNAEEGIIVKVEHCFPSDPCFL